MGSSDDDVRSWGTSFVDLVASDPTAVGLTTTIATNLQTKLTAFSNSIDAARGELTRGPSTVFAKRLARKEFQDYVRLQVKTIKGTPTVTAQQMHDLGLNVPGPISPINPPTEKPILEVAFVDGRFVEMRLRRPGSDRRAKPAGCVGATICIHAGETAPPMNPTDWTMIGEVSRTNFEIEVPGDIAPGAKVWALAYWKNPRLMSGPPSDPVSFYVGGGASMPAAA
jgi:hypothetical protein